MDTKHRIPRELKNEDHWIKNLTLSESVLVVFFVLLDWNILKFTYGAGILPVGIFLTVFITVPALLLIFCPIPDEYYICCGGLRAWKLILRILLRRCNRKIYVSNYNRDRG